MPYFLNPRLLRLTTLQLGGTLPPVSLSTSLIPQPSPGGIQPLSNRPLLVRSYPRFNQNIGQSFVPVTRIGTSLFSKLVTESTVFVDKTRFIKDFLNSNANPLLCTYPRRWGKSINLDMIKTFVEIEVDKEGRELAEKDKKNPKLFSHGKVGQDGTKGPLAIFSEKEFIKEHMGKHPVISISFKDVQGKDYQALEKAMKIKIEDLYKDHEYLLRSKNLSDLDKKSVEEYITSSSPNSVFDTEDLKVSLEKLGKFLHQHFNQKIVVLIDEYDAPINYVYRPSSRFREEDCRLTIQLISGLLGNILKGKAEEYTYKGLVTGILRVAKADLFSNLNNLVESNILDKKYSAYYGFTEKEVNDLLDSYGVPAELREVIKAWYNGYNLGKLQIYNPWSIVNCLSNWQDNKEGNLLEIQKSILRGYWQESGSIDSLNNVFKRPLVKEKIERLIKGDTLYLSNPLQPLSSHEFNAIRKLANSGSNVEQDQNSVSIFFSYLFTAGYLTSSEEFDEFKIPNHEIRLEFERKILVLYRELYNIDDSFFKAVTNVIQRYLDAPKSDFAASIKTFEQDFTNSFQILLHQFPEFKKLSSEGINEQAGRQQMLHANEDIIHSIINYIVLQVKTMSKFATELPVYGKRADVVLTDERNNKAIIIELKYSGSAEDALEQIKQRQYAQTINRHLDTTIVGLNVDRDKKVDVAIEHLPRTCSDSAHTFVPSRLKLGRAV